MVEWVRGVDSKVEWYKLLKMGFALVLFLSSIAGVGFVVICSFTVAALDC